MIYILFASIFCLLLVLVIVVRKQNHYLKDHGINLSGRVIRIDEKTINRKKGRGTYTVKLPVIEYPYKGQMWHLEGDIHAPLDHKIGDMINLVVHPEVPLAMTKKELEQRNILFLIFTGLLIVPIGLGIGFYAFNADNQLNQMVLFEDFGITVQHLYDYMAIAALVTLVYRLFPVWKRLKNEKGQSFLGLPYNAKVVPQNRTSDWQPSTATSN